MKTDRPRREILSKYSDAAFVATWRNGSINFTLTMPFSTKTAIPSWPPAARPASKPPQPPPSPLGLRLRGRGVPRGFRGRALLSPHSRRAAPVETPVGRQSGARSRAERTIPALPGDCEAEARSRQCRDPDHRLRSLAVMEATCAWSAPLILRRGSRLDSKSGRKIRSHPATWTRQERTLARMPKTDAKGVWPAICASSDPTPRRTNARYLREVPPMSGSGEFAGRVH